MSESLKAAASAPTVVVLTTSAAALNRLCPLDGTGVERLDDEFVVCTMCREMLTPEEAVLRATPETWAAYLIAGATDTDPDDAPLDRLGPARINCAPA